MPSDAAPPATGGRLSVSAQQLTVQGSAFVFLSFIVVAALVCVVLIALEAAGSDGSSAESSCA